MAIKISQYVLALILAPFLFGVINRVKAYFAGRNGSPLLQLYFDIFKLLKKGAVYSRTTTWIFIAGPVINLSAILAAMLFIPFGGHPSVVSFEGDLVLFIYLLGLARFFTVLAALDTGSSFEGMGASREIQFAVFAEPALFLSLAVLARITGKLSVSDIFANLSINHWAAREPAVLLITASIFIVFLAENCRLPVDDPNTHLELTMIHEVMALDHCGVDFAYILYGSALKFWLLGSLLVGVIIGSYSFGVFFDYAVFIAGMFGLAVVVGVVESTLARMRLIKVPNFLVTACALSALALAFTIGR